MTTDQISPTDTAVLKTSSYWNENMQLSIQIKRLGKKVPLFASIYYFPIAHPCQVTTVFYLLFNM